MKKSIDDDHFGIGGSDGVGLQPEAAEPGAASGGTTSGSSAASGGSAAAQPEAQPAPKPAAVDVSAKAEPIFKDNCMEYHGGSLEGGVGPNLTKIGERKTKAQIAEKINGGGKVMPSFKASLSAGEVETLAAWLATKK